jgi:hypothetical protein
MGSAFTQFFNTIATLLAAIELFAKGLKNVGEWTDESTAAFVDEARITRQQKMAKLNADLATTQDQAAEQVAASKTKAATK